MRILILSEAPMNVDSGGIGQTLYNLFSFTGGKDILCIAPGKELQRFPPTHPFKDCYHTYKFELIELPPNRITRYFYGFVTWLNYSANLLRPFSSTRKAISRFNPDVVVSCPNGGIGVFMHKKLLQGLSVPVVPYFMDDWMYRHRLKWIGGELHRSIKDILSRNRRWMVIGEELAEVLEDRYKVKPRQYLAVHNPVSLQDAPAERMPATSGTIRLAYAGGLWPMHFDALLVVAKAIHLLREKQQLELVVYTRQNFWEWRKNELEKLGVIYGGSIPYNEIHKKLAEADGLVLVSSFSEELYTHAKASVQTKITDYLKSRQLIISCGPGYSANHNFLKKYDCGVCIETQDVNLVAGKLENIVSNIPSLRHMVNNGWHVLEEEFSFEKVHGELQAFLMPEHNR